MPSSPSELRPPSRRIAVAVAAFAGSLAIALASGPSTQAQSEQLDQVRAQQEQIRDRLAQQNAAVDDLLGQVGALRQRERKVAGQLATQEAKLAAARSQLTQAREALARTKRQLQGALNELQNLLVSIYRYGEPDEAEILLSADGLDEIATTTTYFDRIRDYQSGVVTRVRDLRAIQRDAVDEIEASVTRMEAARAAIEKRQRALAASRASLEAQEAALNAAQAERRKQLNQLKGRESSLVEALQAPAPAAADAPSSPAPTENVPAPNGSTASINSDGTATPPAGAPQAVKDVIAAGNQITNTPYVYGGGHGSFESSGYDCSGSVSFALHGGGFLLSPLDSTGFMTWGDPGSGQWITVYSNPGHAYMVVAGIRFDTSGAPPRWQASLRDNAGYVATHPSGY